MTLTIFPPDLLLGFGVPYTIKLAQIGGRMTLTWNNMIGILYGTICHTLVSTLVVMVILRFNVKRAFGGYLIVVYAIYIVIAVLLESKVF